jgi:hypothetical protein
MSNPHFSDYSLLLQKAFRERAWAGTDLTLISAAQQAKPNLFELPKLSPQWDRKGCPIEERLDFTC